MRLFALLAGVLVAIACGSANDHGGFVAPDTGGSSGRANTVAGAGTSSAGAAGQVSTGEGGEAGAVDPDTLAPTVSITSPKQVIDPNRDPPLTDLQVAVLCTASTSTEPGAARVSASTLAIGLLGADGKQIGMPGNVRSTENPNEYTATFTLTDVPDGAVSFVCSASDVSVPARRSSDTVSTFVDHGPLITLKNPALNSAHAVTPAIPFRFSVLPVPLLAADSGADVASVTLQVDGVDVGGLASHELPTTPGEYEIDVDLNDSKLFTPTPTGAVAARVVGTNKRGTARAAEFSFNVDSLGPIIQITAPATPNQFVGGKVTLAFSATDTPAGVDPSTVQVVLNGQHFFYDRKNGWTNPTPNDFTFTFDTQQFGVQIQLAVNIRADDLAGNSSDGASILYYLDNAPPIVDMAPPNLQEVQYVSDSSALCSASFDPLAGSPKDLDVIHGELTRPRALLWDVGNSAIGQDAVYYSDIDNSNTNTVPHLYFQPDTSKPLLKNSDPSKHGAICNAVADETLPLVTLVPLLPAGNAFYPATAAPHSTCAAGTETADSTPSKRLCSGGSAMSRVIQHDAASANPAVPVVYVIPPDTVQCTGTQFQLTNVAKDGWVCLAVSAIDRTGNRAVSAPLRLCLDSTGDPLTAPACATMSVTPPSCVDDCVPPPHFALGLISKPH